MFIGIDIGGTKTAVLLTNQKLTKLCELSHPNNGVLHMPTIIEHINQLLQQANAQKANLRGIGVGVPGIVNPKLGQVSLAVNLSINQPTDIAKPLAKAFSVPILLENDVRLGAIGLQNWLDVDDLVYLNIGTGVAAGVVLNGRLHRGTIGMAGEVGHIPLKETNDILENSISGPAIIRLANAAGLTVAHAGELYQLAAQQQPKAMAIVQSVSQHIAQTILWLVMTYDVEKVLLGGGVTQIGAPFLNPILAELARIRQQSRLAEQMVPSSKIELVPSHLNAGLWGAVCLAEKGAR